MVWALWKTVWKFLKKLKLEAAPLLGVRLKEMSTGRKPRVRWWLPGEQGRMGKCWSKSTNFQLEDESALGVWGVV